MFAAYTGNSYFVSEEYYGCECALIGKIADELVYRLEDDLELSDKLAHLRDAYLMEADLTVEDWSDLVDVHIDDDDSDAEIKQALFDRCRELNFAMIEGEKDLIGQVLNS